eukprot:COSAG05_NODE_917_length_6593_cov_8.024484_7_plen_102_part_00
MEPFDLVSQYCIRRMTATFQGVNINLHGFLDFARAENENPTGPDIQIVLGRPLDIASQNPVYVKFWGSLRLRIADSERGAGYKGSYGGVDGWGWCLLLRTL